MSEIETSKRTAAPGVGGADTPSLTLGDVFRILRSHLAFVAACTLGGLLACLIYLLLHHPVYKAAAVIRIDPTRMNDLAVGSQQGGAPLDENSVLQTEVGVLQSNRVAIRALLSLAPQDFQRLTGLPANYRLPASHDEPLTKQDALVLAGFEENLKVTPQTGTQLINVMYSDRDPFLAARVANSVVLAYTSESLSSRKDSVAQLRSSLSQEIGALRKQVDEAQVKLARFQEANNLLDTQTASNTTLDKLRLLNDRLAQAQADRIVKQAAFRAAQSSTSESLASLYPNANLSELQIQLAQLNTRYAQLAAKFDSQYPPLIDVKRQISLVTQQLDANAQSVQRRLRQESDAAQLVERDLEGQYNAQLESAYKLNRSQADYAVLQSEVTSGRDLLNVLQTKMQQAVVDAEVTGAKIVVVDEASGPTIPTGPRKSVLLASSAIVGFLVGAIISFFFEGSSRKIRLVPDAEKWTGVPVLGVIPDHWGAGRLDGPDKSGKTALSGDTHLVGTGPYREVRDRLLLSLSSLHKIVLLAGVTEEERVDLAAVQIAAAFARAGYKVLVVDAKSPQLAASTSVNSTSLSPRYDVVEPVTRSVSGPTGIAFVSVGSASIPIVDQIASESFAKVLKGWAAEFDIVLISTGALLSTENLLLARRAASVVLVARYNAVRTDAIATLRRTLSEVGAALSGMLIVGVPNESKEGSHALSRP